MSHNLAAITAHKIDGWAPIHIAAASGFEEVIKVLVENLKFVDLQTSAGETSLFLASQNGHLAVVGQLLDRGADVELATTNDGLTPVAAACAHGHLSVVRLLRSRGRARLDALTKDGETPLYLAAVGNHCDIVSELLDSIPDSQSTALINSNGQTALFGAARNNSHDTLELLLSYEGVDLLTPDHAGRTCVHVAARDDRTESLQRLLGAPGGRKALTARDRDGATPLHTAARHGSGQALVLLKQAGADVDAETHDGRTPTFLAAHVGHKQVVQQLVDYMADFERPEVHGWTPLHAACSAGHADIVDVLTSVKADVNIGAENNTSCLYLAVFRGYVKIVEQLLAAGAEVNWQTADGWTALHACAETGNIGVTTALVDMDAKLSVTSKTGDTPVHTAARWGNARFLDYVLGRWKRSEDIACINKPNDVGYTPLRMTARFGHVEAARVLLEAGADLSVVDPYGYTCLHTAAKGGHDTVVRLILDWLSDHEDAVDERSIPALVDTTCPGGWTALHCAAAEGHVEATAALIDAGADVSRRIETNDSPLLLAVRGRHAAVVRLLLENGGADINEVDAAGLTSLRTAVALKFNDVVDVLLKHGANKSQ